MDQEINAGSVPRQSAYPNDSYSALSARARDVYPENVSEGKPWCVGRNLCRSQRRIYKLMEEPS